MTYKTTSAGFLIAQMVVSLALFVVPISTFAQTNSFPQGGQPTNSFPQGSGGSRTIQNPLKVNSIAEFISALLRAVIAIGIPIAVLFIVLAGFKFIAAQGSPSALAEARSNFIYVVIGIAIFIGASAIAELVMATLRQIGVNV